jgi:hypothetical protein
MMWKYGQKQRCMLPIGTQFDEAMLEEMGLICANNKGKGVL